MQHPTILLLLLLSNIFLTTSLSITDTATGFGAVSKPAKTVEVSTKSELFDYATKGGYVIYVNSMIDLSDGYMPTEAGGSSAGLDDLVASRTSYSSYKDLIDAYVNACTTSTDDKSAGSSSEMGEIIWDCNHAYGDMVKLKMASNTWIIGTSANAGFRGGQISINGVSNIVLRNLNIKDAYDPFPHHEKGDGYNAQYDGIVVQGTSENIWIDHCTFEDTLHLINVNTAGSTSEKFQTFDGLLDMKNDCKGITISWNKFQNHDKTMLIGSSDKDGDNTKRTITLHHNYFFNCGQRLPMVRNSQIHIFNNIYEVDNPYYRSQYCIGVRKNSLIIAENNYFGSGINYSFKDSKGTVYASGNSDSAKKCSASFSDSKPFTVPYDYNLDSVEDALSSVKSDAGSGKSFSK